MKYTTHIDDTIDRYIACNMGKLSIVYSITRHKFFLSWYRIPTKHAYQFYNGGK